MRRDKDLKSGEKECISYVVCKRLKTGDVSYLERNVRGEFNRAVALLTVCKMWSIAQQRFPGGKKRSRSMVDVVI